MACISKASQSSLAPCAVSIAKSAVQSGSPFSWFDYPLNHKNAADVVKALVDFTEPIVAVWLVARPVDRDLNGGFMHWCVKAQSRSVLVSIDFLESRGKGAFAVRQRSNLPSEWADFMNYELMDPRTNQRLPREEWPKWEIKSSVTPHALSEVKGSNAYTKNYLSRRKYKMLKKDMTRLNKMRKEDRDYSQFPGHIQTNKRICDIATFCKVFTADNKGYNVVTKNCQQFAATLFAYLLPDDVYQEEKNRIFDLYQSPYDKNEWKNEKARLQNGKGKQQNKESLQNQSNSSQSKPVISSNIVVETPSPLSPESVE